VRGVLGRGLRNRIVSFIIIRCVVFRMYGRPMPQEMRDDFHDARRAAKRGEEYDYRGIGDPGAGIPDAVKCTECEETVADLDIVKDNDSNIVGCFYCLSDDEVEEYV